MIDRRYRRTIRESTGSAPCVGLIRAIREIRVIRAFRRS
jgi:hypothetical protein